VVPPCDTGHLIGAVGVTILLAEAVGQPLRGKQGKKTGAGQTGARLWRERDARLSMHRKGLGEIGGVA
jgi:hypothetical protein